MTGSMGLGDPTFQAGILFGVMLALLVLALIVLLWRAIARRKEELPEYIPMHSMPLDEIAQHARWRAERYRREYPYN